MPLGLGPGQSIPALFPPLRGSWNNLSAIGPLHFCKALPRTLTLPTTWEGVEAVRASRDVSLGLRGQALTQEESRG